MSDEVMELNWFLRKEHKADSRFDSSVYKAHFFLKFGTEIIEHQEFTKDELLEEIRKLRDIGERPMEYEEALRTFSSMEEIDPIC